MAKLLAIRSEKGRGVYSFKKDKNKIILEHAGKLEGVSYRVFKSSEREEALYWTGLKNNKQEKDSETIPKAPKEIELKTIHIGAECRKYLQWYYAEGGNSVAHGDFCGKVTKIDGRGLLFKRLYVEFFDGGLDCIEGKEDHIWIYNPEPFLKKKIKVGDCVAFTGLVYAYKRNNDSIDFSLKQCEEIEKIDEYELPTDEKLAVQSLNILACETCLFSEHCDGINCIAN